MTLARRGQGVHPFFPRIPFMTSGSLGAQHVMAECYTCGRADFEGKMLGPQAQDNAVWVSVIRIPLFPSPYQCLPELSSARTSASMKQYRESAVEAASCRI